MLQGKKVMKRDEYRIIKTEGGQVYYCAECPYRSLETGFCGFCMRKILDELKGKKKEAHGDGIPAAAHEG